jgi:antitoxin component YwqK of YwqJK toxin-antitoxin module
MRHKIWKWYDSEGRIDSIANYSSGKLDGEYRVWHDNSELKISGFFRQNKFDGEWKWFSETGQTDSIKAMSKGLLDGPSKFYFKNGQLKEESNYKLGKLNGEKTTYYISGQLKNKTKYRLNEKMGPFEVWTSNGQLEERGTFLKNQYHGIVQRNYSTGLLASATTYSRGELEGISQIFSPSNFLKKESFFTSNNEIARLEYHDNGRFKRVLIIKSDNILYERKWNVDGFEVTDQNFITGTRTQSDYYLSGQLKYECIYKNEMKHGVEWWFGEDRNPTKINLFNNGILIISHDLSYVGNE